MPQRLPCYLRVLLSSCLLLVKTCSYCMSFSSQHGEQSCHVDEQVYRPCEHVQAAQFGAAAAIWAPRMASAHKASGGGSAEVRSCLLSHAHTLLIWGATVHTLWHTRANYLVHDVGDARYACSAGQDASLRTPISALLR